MTKHPRLRQTEKLSTQVIIHTCVIVCTLFTLIPLFITIVNSLKSNDEIVTNIFMLPSLRDLGAKVANNYSLSFQRSAYPLFNSLVTSVGGAFGNAILGTVLAYIFCHKNFHFKNGIYIFFIMVMLIPSIMGMPVLVPLVSQTLGLKDTYIGYWLPIWGGGQVSAMFLFRTFFGQQPGSVFESAKVEGASDSQIVWYILVPLSIPIMLYYMVTSFAGQYNEYLWPSLIFDKKLTLMPIMLTESNSFNILNERGAVYAMYLVASVPLIITSAISLKFFQSGDFAAGIKL